MLVRNLGGMASSYLIILNVGEEPGWYGLLSHLNILNIGVGMGGMLSSHLKILNISEEPGWYGLLSPQHPGCR